MSERPACWDECGAELLRGFREMGVEAHVTHVPPVVPTPYESLDMRCPHGVLWFTAPTSEQIAQWVVEGVA